MNFSVLSRANCHVGIEDRSSESWWLDAPIAQPRGSDRWV